MQLHISVTPSNSDVEIFRDLRASKASDHFIAESEKVVTRLLESELSINSLYLTQEQFDSKRSLIEDHRQEKDLSVYIASKEEMEKIVGFSLHQGILAAASIPAEKTTEELIATTSKPQLFIILDEIADAENIGAIFRSSFAMNAAAVILDKKSTSPWMRRAVRVSMGAVFRLPILTVDSLAGCIAQLKKAGLRIFATTLGEKAKPIWECDFTQDMALVFGSEGYGIKQEIVDACDEEVSIPMPDSSLNVGIAQGIFLYEVLRQRRPIA